MTTPLSTIQSWPLDQLQSAFTQREVQLHKALEEVAGLRSENNEIRRQLFEISGLRAERDACLVRLGENDEEILSLRKQLAEFHEALQRERSAEWEKQNNELADRLEKALPNFPEVSWQSFPQDLKAAARELRYMATSFTLKANFVPYKLKIREWWWRMTKILIGPPCEGSVPADMESFMREHNIPLEKPEGL